MKQRNYKKYQIRKFHLDEIRKFYGDDLDEATMLNIVELKSAKTKEKYKIIMTQVELQEAEKKILRLVQEYTSLESAGEDIMDVLRLFVNLTDYYASALFFLGFRPKELDAICPSADYHDDIADTRLTEEYIDEEYQYPLDFTGLQPVCPSITADVSKQIIYSLESFIKVLRDEM